MRSSILNFSWASGMEMRGQRWLLMARTGNEAALCSGASRCAAFARYRGSKTDAGRLQLRAIPEIDRRWREYAILSSSGVAPGLMTQQKSKFPVKTRRPARGCCVLQNRPALARRRVEIAPEPERAVRGMCSLGNRCRHRGYYVEPTATAGATPGAQCGQNARKAALDTKRRGDFHADSSPEGRAAVQGVIRDAGRWNGAGFGLRPPHRPLKNLYLVLLGGCHGFGLVPLGLNLIEPALIIAPHTIDLAT